MLEMPSPKEVGWLANQADHWVEPSKVRVVPEVPLRSIAGLIRVLSEVTPEKSSWCHARPVPSASQVKLAAPLLSTSVQPVGGTPVEKSSERTWEEAEPARATTAARERMVFIGVFKGWNPISRVRDETKFLVLIEGIRKSDSLSANFKNILVTAPCPQCGLAFARWGVRSKYIFQMDWHLRILFKLSIPHQEEGSSKVLNRRSLENSFYDHVCKREQK